MYKRLFCIVIFLTLILTLTQFTAADYTLTNGSATESVWVVYSFYEFADNKWPEGWRTTGWYEIQPRGRRTLPVPAGNSVVYIRVTRGGKAVKPANHATRDAFSFWIHPSDAFTTVETNDGTFLRGTHTQWRLETANFYEYPNGGSHTIADEPRLRDEPAQQIYTEAINSVVWIQTNQGNELGAKGSGVLIDKTRKLIVTNEHVIEDAKEIYVFFPWRDANGVLNRDEKFYLENLDWFARNGYVTEGRVVAKNVRNDLAIVQLAQIPSTARVVKHDFSRNVEDSMREGDTVHILGNPGDRLWHWTQGTFLTPQQICLPSEGACLVMEGDAEGGNSGGPVLNGQGMLIGILTAGTDETLAAAAPAKNIKTLLSRVPAYLSPIPPPQIHPKRTFKIRNPTSVTVAYQIRWSGSENWKSYSLGTGYIMMHWSNGQNIPQGHPQIRFDYIGGDQAVTHRTYSIETVEFQEPATIAPVYRFAYNRQGDRLDLYREGFAAPALSTGTPEATRLLSNYPNPFNPETWIPYHLAKPAEVTVAIYSVDGKLVRTLALGHQATGIYQSKSRAAYWDGKNELGETVASGLYFYTLKAGDFTATRKMIIRK